MVDRSFQFLVQHHRHSGDVCILKLSEQGRGKVVLDDTCLATAGLMSSRDGKVPSETPREMSLVIRPAPAAVRNIQQSVHSGPFPGSRLGCALVGCDNKEERRKDLGLEQGLFQTR